MYVVLLQARAKSAHERFPAGERHSVLAFAQADTDDDAISLVAQSLDNAGWQDIEPRKVGEVDAEFVSGKDAFIVGAFEQAATEGCGFVVYTNADE